MGLAFELRRAAWHALRLCEGRGPGIDTSKPRPSKTLGATQRLLWAAAVEQGKGDPMAAAILSAEERSPATCERLASTLGLDMAAYRACVADPATDAKIEERVAWLDEKDYPGLPVIWIENQELLGAQTYASLRAAWQRAERIKDE